MELFSAYLDRQAFLLEIDDDKELYSPTTPRLASSSKTTSSASRLLRIGDFGLFDYLRERAVFNPSLPLEKTRMQ